MIWTLPYNKLYSLTENLLVESNDRKRRRRQQQPMKSLITDFMRAGNMEKVMVEDRMVNRLLVL